MSKTISFEDIMKFHPDNPTVFLEIKKGINRLTPFIGAGLSVPFGYPCWREYLERQTSKVLEEDVQQKIKDIFKSDNVHKYEIVAQLLSDYRGERNFQADVVAEFGKNRLFNSKFTNTSVYLLPLLFEGLVLTTNYDKVLETAYNLHNCAFDVVAHPGHHTLLNASLSGFTNRVLYKFHGDISEEDSLVLTGKSYDHAYDPGGVLVKDLKRCFIQTRLLFLGCSLEEDRTMELLHMVLEPGITHYAFLSCKIEDRAEKIRRLDKLGIRAIIFPDGMYDSVRILLLKLIEDTKPRDVALCDMAIESASRSEMSIQMDSMIDYFTQAYTRLREGISSFYLLQMNTKIFPGLKSHEIQIKSSEDNAIATPMKRYLIEAWEGGITIPLLLVGEGGSGKTVTLLQTCKNFLEDGICVSFIPINELGASGILDYLLWSLWKGNEDKARRFYYSLKSERQSKYPAWILFLDGFNEADENIREGVCRFIREWIGNSNVQIVLSSRFEKLENYGFSQFRHVTVQTLEKQQVEMYLAECGLCMPVGENGLKELLSSPLMLALYTQTEFYQTRFKSSDFINYRIPSLYGDRGMWTAGLIIWNFMQCQIGKALSSNTENYEKLEYILAIEYISPYVCHKMEKRGIFHVEEKTFFDWVELAVEELQLLWKSQKPLRIKRLEIAYPELKTDWHNLNAQRITYILTRRLHIFSCYENRYGLLHHHFRDCLTSVYLINEAELRGSFAQSWSYDVISRNVLRFLSHLMMPDIFEKLWKSVKSRNFPEEDFGMFNVMELAKFERKILSELDFSDMDLRRIYLGGLSFSHHDSVASFSGAQIGEYTFETDMHSTYVEYISFSEDGKYMFSGSENESIVWNTKNWIPIKRIPTDISIRATVCALLPDSKNIFVADDTNTLSLWQIEDEKCLYSMCDHTAPVCHVQVSEDGCLGLSSSEDGTCIIWDLKSGNRKCTLQGHSGKVSCASFSTDGSMVLSGSSDRTLKIWDKKGRCLRTLYGHRADITATAWIPDGTACISGDFQGEVRLWNTNTGEGTLLKVCCDSVVSLSISRNGERCLIGSKNGSLFIWNLKKNICEKDISVEVFRAGSKSLIASSFSMDENICYSVLDNFTIIKYDLRSDNEEKDLSFEFPSSASFSHDREKIVYIDEGKIILFDIVERKCIDTLFGKNSVYGGFTTDGKNLALLSVEASSIRFMDFEKLLVENQLSFNKKLPYDVSLHFGSYSRDRKECIVLPRDRTIELWSINPLQKQSTIYSPISRDVAAALYQAFTCGQPLRGTGKCVIGTQTGDVQLWDFHLQECRFSLRLDPENTYSPGVKCLTCSADNLTCLANIENVIYQVNLDNGTVEHTYMHKDSIKAIAWSSDDKYFVASCRDYTMYCWYPETGECGWIIGERANHIYKCAYFPDGERILLGASDESLRIFNLRECRTESMLEHVDKSGNFEIMPDGIRCVLWNESSISMWNLQTGQIESISPVGDNYNIYKFALTADGDKCYTIERYGIIDCWNLPTGVFETSIYDIRGIFSSTGYSILPTDLAISPDNKFLTLGSTGHRSYVYNLEKRQGFELYSQGCTVMKVAFSPNGQYMAGGSGHGEVFLWNLYDLPFKRFPHAFSGHRSRVTKVIFSSDSQNVISSSKDMTIRVWNIANFECKNVLQVGKSIKDIQMLKDDVHCVCIPEEEMSFSIWNLISGKCCKEINLLQEVNIVDCDFSSARFDRNSTESKIYWSGGKV